VILVIDNYDSFTFNLVQYVCELGAAVEVIRNDDSSFDFKKNKLAGIVISPGPGRPQQAGMCINVIRELAPLQPILGVCLGHQAIGCAFGGEIVSAPKLMHGKTSFIYHNSLDLFAGIANPFEATRYHSLIVDRATLPAELTVTAETDDHLIMGLQHRSYPLYGVQFHPESILTTEGKKILANFLKVCQTCGGRL
jgi:anthranilate synthase/aminodeoxychorismate synthase-like glutamine amidotransferase